MKSMGCKRDKLDIFFITVKPQWKRFFKPYRAQLKYRYSAADSYIFRLNYFANVGALKTSVLMTYKFLTRVNQEGSVTGSVHLLKLFKNKRIADSSETFLVKVMPLLNQTS